MVCNYSVRQSALLLSQSIRLFIYRDISHKTYPWLFFRPGSFHLGHFRRGGTATHAACLFFFWENGQICDLIKLSDLGLSASNNPIALRAYTIYGRRGVLPVVFRTSDPQFSFIVLYFLKKNFLPPKWGQKQDFCIQEAGSHLKKKLQPLFLTHVHVHVDDVACGKLAIIQRNFNERSPSK